MLRRGLVLYAKSSHSDLVLEVFCQVFPSFELDGTGFVLRRALVLYAKSSFPFSLTELALCYAVT